MATLIYLMIDKKKTLSLIDAPKNLVRVLAYIQKRIHLRFQREQINSFFGYRNWEYSFNDCKILFSLDNIF